MVESTQILQVSVLRFFSLRIAKIQAGLWVRSPSNPLLQEKDRLGLVLAQLYLYCPRSDSSPRLKAQFGQDIPDVVFYRPLAEDKFIGDLTVRFTLRDQRRYLTLSRGQPAKLLFGGAARRDGLFFRQPVQCRADKAFTQECIVNCRPKCLDNLACCGQLPLGVILAPDTLV